MGVQLSAHRMINARASPIRARMEHAYWRALQPQIVMRWESLIQNALRWTERDHACPHKILLSEEILVQRTRIVTVVRCATRMLECATVIVRQAMIVRERSSVWRRQHCQ